MINPRTLLAPVALLAALALTGCGGGEEPASEPTKDDTTKLSEALCNDLDDGHGPMQIIPEDMSPEEFAGHLDTATEEVCPKHRDDPAVETLLTNWGYES